MKAGHRAPYLDRYSATMPDGRVHWFGRGCLMEIPPLNVGDSIEVPVRHDERQYMALTFLGFERNAEAGAKFETAFIKPTVGDYIAQIWRIS